MKAPYVVLTLKPSNLTTHPTPEKMRPAAYTPRKIDSRATTAHTLAGAVGQPEPLARLRRAMFPTQNARNRCSARPGLRAVSVRRGPGRLAELVGARPPRAVRGPGSGPGPRIHARGRLGCPGAVASAPCPRSAPPGHEPPNGWAHPGWPSQARPSRAAPSLPFSARSPRCAGAPSGGPRAGRGLSAVGGSPDQLRERWQWGALPAAFAGAPLAPGPLPLVRSGVPLGARRRKIPLPSGRSWRRCDVVPVNTLKCFEPVNGRELPIITVKWRNSRPVSALVKHPVQSPGALTPAIDLGPTSATELFRSTRRPSDSSPSEPGSAT